MQNKIAGFASLVIAGLFAFPALSAEIEVKMLNKGGDGQAMVFEPATVKAAVGDVITFIPVDKGHDAAAVKDMIPEGVSEFKGKMNEAVKLTVEKEGAYVVKCTPHLGMGMVALVVVGDAVPANLDAVKSGKLPKKARDRLNEEIARLGL
ncbi:UNVERIFIED_ORG: pseudoazurin [Rhizobium sp. SORGH_AS260]|jgi:pseudoazurin|uniref:Pseudoazurin n=1 Tax=Bradyrhizobium lupini HPC(L) TaxID=1229491 RepID=A0ABN0HJ29_RHILU|nr:MULTISPECIES: pseudoazurin [Agrobacterium]EKJ94613.1 pseudoazurin [Bradyrhizobium lupini HPC(L)]MDP9733911.1 pseudoazurin [Rhizobium sp. SORGH_AS_0285]MDP9754260.1 pseudoazurin [Rhizobium sp. SORGH_AS_0260]MCJ2875713.1 pseudoazurin [Agrobacterium pusense]MDR6083091.1 pseudoazurin [Agrobacterium sp. SORGH_AS_0440]